MLPLAQPHHDDPLRGAAGSLDVVDRHLDHRAAVGDEHHLVPVTHDARAGQLPLRLRQLHCPDSEPPATLDGIVTDRGALPITVLRHHQHVGVVVGNVDRDHLVTHT